MKKAFLFLLSMLCADIALAEPPAPPPPTKTQQAASELVKQRLLQPLTRAESKRSRFSRAAPVSKQRRVRVLDLAALTDARGKLFVRFAIDERYGWDEDEQWEIDAFVGCAYLDQKQVFLKRGDDYVPARSALGGADDVQPDVCRAAPQTGVQVASAAP